MAFSPMPAALPRRAGAFALDYLLIAAWLVVVVGLGVLARAAVPRLAATISSDPIAAEAAGFLLLTLPVGLYFALSEARPSGATWGKRRMGIGVVAAAGEPPSIGRSVLRTALKLLPWELAHGVIWRFAIPGLHAGGAARCRPGARLDPHRRQPHQPPGRRLAPYPVRPPLGHNRRLQRRMSTR
jgi:uncharacterized RDD family membrane protein YckC